MSLPDLALQIIYGRLAWALLAAALLLAVWPALWPRIAARLPAGSVPAVVTTLVTAVFPDAGRRTIAIVVAASLALMALPGSASPAYWLTLVFQYPSGLLLGCSLVSLCARWQGRPVRFTMHPGIALALAAAGLVLYLDAFGVLALGLYYGGFGATAPLLACAAAVVAAVAVMLGRAVATATATLAGLLLFSLLRLPTGNLWDALLDPLLWAWAVGSAFVAARQFATARRASLAQSQAQTPSREPVPTPAQPALDPDDIPELARVHAGGGIE
jgi:hypothetical protein